MSDKSFSGTMINPFSVTLDICPLALHNAKITGNLRWGWALLECSEAKPGTSVKFPVHRLVKEAMVGFVFDDYLFYFVLLHCKIYLTCIERRHHKYCRFSRAMRLNCFTTPCFDLIIIRRSIWIFPINENQNPIR